MAEIDFKMCEFCVSLECTQLLRDAPRLTHFGVTQITVVSRYEPFICQAAYYEGHMHPVFIQEQNFAHFPEEPNHVCDAQESAATVIIAQKTT